MALRRPGSASRFTFLTTASAALVMIAVLIGGHLVFAFFVYSKITGGTGMVEIAEFTDLPAWSLWLSIVAAAALDVWILYHQRQDRLKALRR
ncbi:MAG: hypothetical protein ABUK11_03295 [Mariprofundaceae bacterium]